MHAFARHTATPPLRCAAVDRKPFVVPTARRIVPCGLLSRVLGLACGGMCDVHDHKRLGNTHRSCINEDFRRLARDSATGGDCEVMQTAALPHGKYAKIFATPCKISACQARCLMKGGRCPRVQAGHNG